MNSPCCADSFARPAVLLHNGVQAWPIPQKLCQNAGNAIREKLNSQNSQGWDTAKPPYLKAKKYKNVLPIFPSKGVRISVIRLHPQCLECFQKTLLTSLVLSLLSTFLFTVTSFFLKKKKKGFEIA